MKDWIETSFKLLKEQKLSETMKLIEKGLKKGIDIPEDEFKGSWVSFEARDILRVFNNYLYACWKTKKLKKAEAFIQSYKKYFPLNPSIFHHTSCIYTALKQERLALGEVKKAHKFGYDRMHLLLKDEDLKPLFSKKEFQQIINSRFYNHKGKKYKSLFNDFVTDGQNVYYKGEEKFKRMKTVDLSSFEMVNQKFTKDRKAVYILDTLIEGSDPATFDPMDDCPDFSKDKNHVYASLGENTIHVIRGADPASFISMGWNSFGTDKDFLFHHFDTAGMEPEIQWRAWRKYLSNDSESKNLSKVNDELEEFVKKNGKISKSYWFSSDYKNNPESSTKINENFRKNKTCVFLKIDEFHGTKEPVFCLIRGADPKTFQPLNEFYSKDKSKVYFKQYTVEDADVKTFQVMKGFFAKDKETVFWNGYPVEDLSPRKIKIIRHDGILNHAKDDKLLYTTKLVKRPYKLYAPDYALSPQKKSNATTLKKLSNHYSKDSKQVYCHGKAMKQADVTTFEYLFTSDAHSDWAKDKNHLYDSNGRRIVKGIKGKDFKVLSPYWGKDKSHVYCFYTERIIKTADAKTFEAIDEDGAARDKNYRYSFEKDKWGCITMKKRKTKS